MQRMARLPDGYLQQCWSTSSKLGHVWIDSHSRVTIGVLEGHAATAVPTESAPEPTSRPGGEVERDSVD